LSTSPPPSPLRNRAAAGSLCTPPSCPPAARAA
jgi:hypothetical protein